MGGSPQKRTKVSGAFEGGRDINNISRSSFRGGWGSCGKNGRMFQTGHSPPCITARRGGCVIKKISRSDRSGRSRGGFPYASIGKPPRPRDQRRLRDIFLIARPQMKYPPFLSGADMVVLVNKFGCAARGFDQHHPGGAEYLR